MRAGPPRLTRTDHVLLTGATGLVGGAVLAELLSATDAGVTCVVRARDGRSARRRVEAVVEAAAQTGDSRITAERVSAVAAGEGSDPLALDDGVRGALLERVTHVIHCGARLGLQTPMATARAVNVGGVARIVGLALDARRRGREVRVTLLSTAFVAGLADRPFCEHELDVGQGFRNALERSSFEAEALARRWMGRLDITVVRPSIVAGSRLDGQTAAPQALDAPLGLLLGPGSGSTLPVRHDLLVDVVPVDWVAGLAVRAATHGEAGRTYAAASGSRAPTMGDLVDLAGRLRDDDPPALLPPETADEVVEESIAAWRRRLPQPGRGLLDAYRPYLAHPARFDAWRGDHLMWRAGVPAFDPLAVLEGCLRDARRADLGRLLQLRRPAAA